VAVLSAASPSRAPAAEADDLVVIKEIRTYGNVKTEPGILLHYCEFKVGDELTQAELDRKVARTKRNLLKTQFFDRVNVFDLPRSTPGEAVIMLDVAEGSSWHLSASTWQARLSKENVGGVAVELGVEFGLELQRLYYEQPWIFGSRFAVGAAGFYEGGHQINIESDEGLTGEWFSYEAAGGDGSLSYVITHNLQIGSAFLGQFNNYYDGRFKEDPWGRFGVREEATLAAAKPFVEWDGRDDDVFPTRGLYANFEGELASPAVGDYAYQGIEGDVRGYVYPWREFVWAMRVKGGAMSDATPYIRRLSIRGADGLRNPDSNITIGTRAVVVTGEFRRRLFRSPIFDAWFEGVAFVDAGRAWDPGQPVGFEHLSYACGPGIRVHMRKPFYFDWRAELNVYNGLAFYATAQRSF
jgi:outer membrane protein assembly factor BamA